MLRKVLLAILVGFAVLFVQAQPMRIGLFPTQKFTKIKFANAIGSYFIIADTTFIGVMDHFSFCEISKSVNGTLDIVFHGLKTSGVKELKIIASEREKSVEISGIAPSMKARSFEGDFLVRSNNGSLLIVNQIDLETYLEGVVESEAGTGQKLEYYKVQSIISRTFAMKSKQKHAKDGFDLCNQVHCQAYLHKRNGSPIIDSAIKATRGQIMLHEDSTLAPTFFSANCGGQTCEPSQVWNASINGLTSFRDTFCIYTKQATWTKQIALSQWKSYLVEKYHYPIDDSTSAALILNWSSNTRPAFLFHPGYGIPMRDLREHFNLKSAYFSVSSDGNMVTLSGRGFGHGVGLCQEGAMKMARLSYSYDQILGFYFPLYRLSFINSNYLLE